MKPLVLPPPSVIDDTNGWSNTEEEGELPHLLCDVNFKIVGVKDENDRNFFIGNKLFVKLNSVNKENLNEEQGNGDSTGKQIMEYREVPFEWFFEEKSEVGWRAQLVKVGNFRHIYVVDPYLGTEALRFLRALSENNIESGSNGGLFANCSLRFPNLYGLVTEMNELEILEMLAPFRGRCRQVSVWNLRQQGTERNMSVEEVQMMMIEQSGFAELFRGLSSSSQRQLIKRRFEPPESVYRFFTQPTVFRCDRLFVSNFMGSAGVLMERGDDGRTTVHTGDGGLSLLKLHDAWLEPSKGKSEESCSSSKKCNNNGKSDDGESEEAVIYGRTKKCLFLDTPRMTIRRMLNDVGTLKQRFIAAGKQVNNRRQKLCCASSSFLMQIHGDKPSGTEVYTKRIARLPTASKEKKMAFVEWYPSESSNLFVRQCPDAEVRDMVREVDGNSVPLRVRVSKRDYPDFMLKSGHPIHQMDNDEEEGEEAESNNYAMVIVSGTNTKQDEQEKRIYVDENASATSSDNASESSNDHDEEEEEDEEENEEEEDDEPEEQ